MDASRFIKPRMDLLYMPRATSGIAFIRKATVRHGARYDYSKVQYKNSTTRVTIICRKHRPFRITPRNHLSGRGGCRECGSDLARVRYTKPFSVFVEQARKLHGTKYAYVKSTYRNAILPMSIRCPSHGNFLQRPDSHLQGAGCKQCASVLIGMKNRISASAFLARARKKFGKAFDYSETHYEAMRRPVTIKCKKHGPFRILPVDFLGNIRGCSRCSGTGFRKTTDFFVSQLKEKFGSKYDLRKVRYVNQYTAVELKCGTHGRFMRSPETLMQARGCQRCAMEASEGKRLKHLRRVVAAQLDARRESFLAAAKRKYGNRFDYSKAQFIRQKLPIAISCKRHGEFLQTPAGHLVGGCRKCANEDLKGRYTDTYFKHFPSEKKRSAILYYIQIRSRAEDFFKIGVTTTRLKTRFGGYLAKGRCSLTIHRHRNMSLWRAYRTEQSILAGHGRRFAYRPRLMSRKIRSLVGVTECFSRQLPNQLLNRYF